MQTCFIPFQPQFHLCVPLYYHQYYVYSLKRKYRVSIGYKLPQLVYVQSYILMLNSEH